jgi:hypothetical protein
VKEISDIETMTDDYMFTSETQRTTRKTLQNSKVFFTRLNATITIKMITKFCLIFIVYYSVQPKWTFENFIYKWCYLLCDNDDYDTTTIMITDWSYQYCCSQSLNVTKKIIYLIENYNKSHKREKYFKRNVKICECQHDC